MSGGGRGRYDQASAGTDAFAVQELNRKVNNIVRYGTIDKIDHKKARCRVKIGPLMSAWIPWHAKHAGNDADWAPPSAGEQVSIFSPSGNLSQAVIMGGLYQDKFPAPSKDKNERVHKLKDGTTITHNIEKKTRITAMPKDGAHTLQVDKQKQTVDTKGSRLENDKGVVHLHPDGKIRKLNDAGSVVLDSGGQLFLNC